MKFAIIGTGKAARNLVKAAIKIGSEVDAVCSNSIVRAGKFASQVGISKYFDDINVMLEKCNVDGVIIAGVPAEHANAIKLASKYVDIMVVEKPLVCKVNDLGLIDGVEKVNKSISIVYQHRYNKSLELLRKDLKSYSGKLMYINLELSQLRNANYFTDSGGWRNDLGKAGGGVVLQHGIHWINLICSIVGYECEIVDYGYNKIGEIEVLASINLKFGDIKCNIFLSWSTPSKETKITIFGENRIWEMTRSTYNVRKSEMNLMDKVRYYMNNRLPVVITGFRNLRKGSYVDVLRNVVEKNQGVVRESVFLRSAINDVKLINKIYEFGKPR